MGGRQRLCFRLALVRGCEINRGVRGHIQAFRFSPAASEPTLRPPNAASNLPS